MERSALPSCCSIWWILSLSAGVLWAGLHVDGPGRPVVYYLEWDLAHTEAIPLTGRIHHHSTKPKIKRGKRI